MKEEKKKLNVAEKCIVKHLRQWPTLYKNAKDFFHNCVVGSIGSPLWKNGKLVMSDKQYKGTKGGKAIYKDYPFRISEELAASFLNVTDLFPHVYPCGPAPIDDIPDNIHPDWIDFISNQLYQDSKIPPDLYDVMLESHCIVYYGVRSNHNASYDRNRNEWAKYHAKIPSYEARLRLIEETRRNGSIPPDRYQGIDI